MGINIGSNIIGKSRSLGAPPNPGWATTATEEFSQSIQAPSSMHPGISYPVRANPSLRYCLLGHLPLTGKGRVGCSALSSLKNPLIFQIFDFSIFEFSIFAFLISDFDLWISAGTNCHLEHFSISFFHV